MTRKRSPVSSTEADLQLVGAKKVEEISSMDEPEVKAVLRQAMARFYRLTGRKTVVHMPEEEINQAFKEFNKVLKPVTVNDFRQLKLRSDKSAADFCLMLGITRQRYYEISLRRDKNEVLKEIPLSLLVRLYMKLPSLIPTKTPNPVEVHGMIGGDDAINLQALAIVLGRGSASTRRWKQGQQSSEDSKPMIDALSTSDRAEDVFTVMVDNVYEEGSVRGLTPFKDMGWNGVPSDGPVDDLDRDFLSMPTVDHRRVDAREGKIIGWGATDPGIKHIKKTVGRKKAK